MALSQQCTMRIGFRQMNGYPFNSNVRLVCACASFQKRERYANTKYTCRHRMRKGYLNIFVLASKHLRGRSLSLALALSKHKSYIWYTLLARYVAEQSRKANNKTINRFWDIFTFDKLILAALPVSCSSGSNRIKFHFSDVKSSSGEVITNKLTFEHLIGLDALVSFQVCHV